MSALRGVQSLEVNNFKSYYGTTYIGPFKDFTSIVGPNGSGKSNIIDALIFVLGINTNKIRIDRLSDLINHDVMSEYFKAKQQQQQQHTADDDGKTTSKSRSQKKRQSKKMMDSEEESEGDNEDVDKSDSDYNDQQKQPSQQNKSSSTTRLSPPQTYVELTFLNDANDVFKFRRTIVLIPTKQQNVNVNNQKSKAQKKLQKKKRKGRKDDTSDSDSSDNSEEDDDDDDTDVSGGDDDKAFAALSSKKGKNKSTLSNNKNITTSQQQQHSGNVRTIWTVNGNVVNTKEEYLSALASVGLGYSHKDYIFAGTSNTYTNDYELNDLVKEFVDTVEGYNTTVDEITLQKNNFYQNSKEKLNQILLQDKKKNKHSKFDESEEDEDEEEKENQNDAKNQGNNNNINKDLTSLTLSKVEQNLLLYTSLEPTFIQQNNNNNNNGNQLGVGGITTSRDMLKSDLPPFILPQQHVQIFSHMSAQQLYTVINAAAGNTVLTAVLQQLSTLYQQYNYHVIRYQNLLQHFTKEKLSLQKQTEEYQLYITKLRDYQALLLEYYLYSLYCNDLSLYQYITILLHCDKKLTYWKNLILQKKYTTTYQKYEVELLQIKKDINVKKRHIQQLELTLQQPQQTINELEDTLGRTTNKLKSYEDDIMKLKQDKVDIQNKIELYTVDLEQYQQQYDLLLDIQYDDDDNEQNTTKKSQKSTQKGTTTTTKKKKATKNDNDSDEDGNNNNVNTGGVMNVFQHYGNNHINQSIVDEFLRLKSTFDYRWKEYCAMQQQQQQSQQQDKSQNDENDISDEDDDDNNDDDNNNINEKKEIQKNNTKLSNISVLQLYSLEETTQQDITSLYTNLNTMNSNLKHINNKLTLIQNKLQTQQDEININNNTINKYQSELGQINKDIRLYDIERIKTMHKYQILNKKLILSQSYLNRLQFNKKIHDIVKELQSFFGATKVYGLCSDIIRPKKVKFQNALNAALGRYNNAIIVSDVNIADHCIDYLNRRHLGHYTFLSLSYIQGQLYLNTNNANTGNNSLGFGGGSGNNDTASDGLLNSMMNILDKNNNNNQDNNNGDDNNNKNKINKLKENQNNYIIQRNNIIKQYYTLLSATQEQLKKRQLQQPKTGLVVIGNDNKNNQQQQNNNNNSQQQNNNNNSVFYNYQHLLTTEYDSTYVTLMTTLVQPINDIFLPIVYYLLGNVIVDVNIENLMLYAFKDQFVGAKYVTLDGDVIHASKYITYSSNNNPNNINNKNKEKQNKNKKDKKNQQDDEPENDDDDDDNDIDNKKNIKKAKANKKQHSMNDDDDDDNDNTNESEENDNNNNTVEKFNSKQYENTIIKNASTSQLLLIINDLQQEMKQLTDIINEKYGGINAIMNNNKNSSSNSNNNNPENNNNKTKNSDIYIKNLFLEKKKEEYTTIHYKLITLKQQHNNLLLEFTFQNEQLIKTQNEKEKIEKKLIPILTSKIHKKIILLNCIKKYQKKYDLIKDQLKDEIFNTFFDKYVKSISIPYEFVLKWEILTLEQEMNNVIQNSNQLNLLQIDKITKIKQKLQNDDDSDDDNDSNGDDDNKKNKKTPQKKKINKKTTTPVKKTTTTRGGGNKRSKRNNNTMDDDDENDQDEDNHNDTDSDNSDDDDNDDNKNTKNNKDKESSLSKKLLEKKNLLTSLSNDDKNKLIKYIIKTDEEFNYFIIHINKLYENKLQTLKVSISRIENQKLYTEQQLLIITKNLLDLEKKQKTLKTDIDLGHVMLTELKTQLTTLNKQHAVVKEEYHQLQDYYTQTLLPKQHIFFQVKNFILNEINKIEQCIRICLNEVLLWQRKRNLLIDQANQHNIILPILDIEKIPNNNNNNNISTTFSNNSNENDDDEERDNNSDIDSNDDDDKIQTVQSTTNAKKRKMISSPPKAKNSNQNQQQQNKKQKQSKSKNKNIQDDIDNDSDDDDEEFDITTFIAQAKAKMKEEEQNFSSTQNKNKNNTNSDDDDSSDDDDDDDDNDSDDMGNGKRRRKSHKNDKKNKKKQNSKKSSKKNNNDDDNNDNENDNNNNNNNNNTKLLPTILTSPNYTPPVNLAEFLFVPDVDNLFLQGQAYHLYQKNIKSIKKRLPSTTVSQSSSKDSDNDNDDGLIDINLQAHNNYMIDFNKTQLFKGYYPNSNNVSNDDDNINDDNDEFNEREEELIDIEPIYGISPSIHLYALIQTCPTVSSLLLNEMTVMNNHTNINSNSNNNNNNKTKDNKNNKKHNSKNSMDDNNTDDDEQNDDNDKDNKLYLNNNNNNNNNNNTYKTYQKTLPLFDYSSIPTDLRMDILPTRCFEYFVQYYYFNWFNQYVIHHELQQIDEKQKDNNEKTKNQKNKKNQQQQLTNTKVLQQIKLNLQQQFIEWQKQQKQKYHHGLQNDNKKKIKNNNNNNNNQLLSSYYSYNYLQHIPKLLTKQEKTLNEFNNALESQQTDLQQLSLSTAFISLSELAPTTTTTSNQDDSDSDNDSDNDDDKKKKDKKNKEKQKKQQQLSHLDLIFTTLQQSAKCTNSFLSSLLMLRKEFLLLQSQRFMRVFKVISKTASKIYRYLTNQQGLLKMDYISTDNNSNNANISSSSSSTRQQQQQASALASNNQQNNNNNINNNFVYLQATPSQAQFKTLTSAAMLSGGEKGLVSICVLLAIIHAIQCGVAILDEVDANLDNTTVIRLSSFIQQQVTLFNSKMKKQNQKLQKEKENNNKKDKNNKKRHSSNKNKKQKMDDTQDDHDDDNDDNNSDDLFDTETESNNNNNNNSDDDDGNDNFKPPFGGFSGANFNLFGTNDDDSDDDDDDDDDDNIGIRTRSNNGKKRNNKGKNDDDDDDNTNNNEVLLELYQCICISLKNDMYSHADALVGVTAEHMQTRIFTLDLTKFRF